MAPEDALNQRTQPDSTDTLDAGASPPTSACSAIPAANSVLPADDDQIANIEGTKYDDATSQWPYSLSTRLLYEIEQYIKDAPLPHSAAYFQCILANQRNIEATFQELQVIKNEMAQGFSLFIKVRTALAVFAGWEMPRTERTLPDDIDGYSEAGRERAYRLYLRYLTIPLTEVLEDIQEDLRWALTFMDPESQIHCMDDLPSYYG